MKQPIVGLILGLAIAPVAFAGAIFETVDRDLKTAKETGGSIVYAQGGMLRVEHGDKVRSSQVMIFRDNVLYDIDAGKKTYHVMDKATMKGLSAKANAAMAEAKAQMANMPPEQRAQMEAMMARMGQPGGTGAKPPPAPKRELVRTGKTEQVAGYTCTGWDEKLQGVLESQYCVVPPGGLVGGAELYSTMVEFAKFMKEITGDMPGARAMRDSMTADFDQMKGYPVLTRDIENGSAVRETRVKSSRTENLPAALFEVPKGFKQEKLGVDSDD